MREWLPQVESELKFRSLPENEEAIVDLIEKHDVRIGASRQIVAVIRRVCPQDALYPCSAL